MKAPEKPARLRLDRFLDGLKDRGTTSTDDLSDDELDTLLALSLKARDERKSAAERAEAALRQSSVNMQHLLEEYDQLQIDYAQLLGYYERDVGALKRENARLQQPAVHPVDALLDDAGGPDAITLEGIH
jgi:hypothetical protein